MENVARPLAIAAIDKHLVIHANTFTVNKVIVVIFINDQTGKRPHAVFYLHLLLAV